MNTKKFIAVSKKFNKTSRKLPILNTMLYKNGQITMTDLANYVVFKQPDFEINGDFCVGITQFLDLLSICPQPIIKVDGPKILFSQGSDKGSILGENTEDFPSTKENIGGENIGFIDQQLFKQLEVAVNFISVDELRPALMSVYIKDQIASTDAHKLFFEPVASPFTKQLLISEKTIQLMKILGDNFQVSELGEYITFENSEHIIYQKIINERYPNFNEVIPRDNPNSVTVDTKLFTTKVSAAIKMANKLTPQIELSINGEFKISSENIDLATEYSTVIPAKMNGEIKIGFNGNFLLEALKHSGKTTTIVMSTPNRGGIINGNLLLMPVMLNSYS